MLLFLLLLSSSSSCQILIISDIFSTDFRKGVKCQTAEQLREYGRTDRQTGVALLTVAFRNFANLYFWIKVQLHYKHLVFKLRAIFSFVFVSIWRLLQTDSHLIPLAAFIRPALCWTATTAQQCQQVPSTSHITHAVWTHCWPSTISRRNISADQRALQSCSVLQEYSAMVNSQVLWRAITKRWKKGTARHTRFGRTGGLLGVGFHWTTIDLPHTCLVSRRLQWGRARWRHTLDQLSKQTPGERKCSAPCGPGDWTCYGGD